MEGLREKLLFSAVVYFLFLQLALRYGISGTTATDMAHNLGVDIDTFSVSVSIMCAGICLGAISSDFILKILSREMTVFMLILLTSALEIMIALDESYPIFLVLDFFIGFTSGACISLCEAWILQIWGSECGPYMQALQFFRGLGYIISPVLSEPFLTHEDHEEAIEDSTDISITNVTTEFPTTEKPGKLQAFNYELRIPLFLNATMLILGAAFTLTLWWFRRRREFAVKGNPNIENALNGGVSSINILSNSTISLGTDTHGQLVIANEHIPDESLVVNKRVRYFGYLIIALSSIFYLFFYEELIVILLPAFAKNIKLKIKTSEVSMLTTATMISNVAGKSLGVLLALKLSHMIILYSSLMLMFGSLSLLILFSETSKLMLWIGWCLHGAGVSSVIGALYTMLEKNIEVSPLICGILNTSGTMGSVIIPLIVGPFIKSNPIMIVYAFLGCTCLCTIFMLVINWLINNKSRFITVKDDAKVGSTATSFKNSMKNIEIAHHNYGFDDRKPSVLSVVSLRSN